MAAVQIRQIVKSFGATKVLRGVDVDIRDGEFMVLVGPSGCGKTTLLRMVAGLEAVTSGEISIGPRVVNNVPSKDRDIAMVFQNYALYPHLRVKDNITFALRLKRTPKAEIESKVERVADILGLGSLLDRFPRQLSGGQRQRVAMGRAIIRDPKVFLFDEPLSNLDAKLRVAMRAEMKSLHARLSTTTIYVTHDQIEAMTMADRIVVMRDGVVEQIGEPLALYDFPANLFVAGFIGSPAMNLVPGRVNEGKFVANCGFIVPLGERFGSVPAGPVTFGFRPEHVRIESGGFDVKVSVIEPTGSETQVIAHAGQQVVTCVFRDRVTLHMGQVIQLVPDMNRAHIFASDGKRIPTREES